MNMDRLYDVLLAPRVTEKTARVGESSNQYVFRVRRDADKTEIKNAVEQIFDVQVESVQVVNVKGKAKAHRFRIGRRSDWKKAYVRIQEGQSIDLLGSESA